MKYILCVLVATLGLLSPWPEASAFALTESAATPVENSEHSEYNHREPAVLIAHPATPSEEYQFVIDTNPNSIAFLDYWTEERTRNQASRDLTAQLAQAQEAWIRSEMELAQSAFLKIVAKIHQEDWNEDQQKAIQYAFLRLAEITNDPSWIDQALQFSPDLSVPEAELKPEWVRIFNERKIAHKKKLIAVDIRRVFKDFDYLYLNGKRWDLSLSNKALIAPGMVRVTAISAKHMPVTRVVQAQQIPYLRFPRADFLSGSCEKPQITPDARQFFENRRVLAMYLNAECLKEISHGLMLSSTPPAGGAKIQTMDSKQSQLKKSSWRWWAAGAALAFGFFVIRSQTGSKSEKPSEPVHIERP